MNSSNTQTRSIYLEDVPLDTARERLRTALEEIPEWPPLRATEIPLSAALDHVTAAPVWARISSPHFPAAAMDGIAVSSASTAGASETTPRQLQLGTEAVWIDTGDPIPTSSDAVVMVEDLHDRGDGTVEVLKPVAPWQHVRPIGEDIVTTELVVPQGCRLKPHDLGAIAASGHASVQVIDPPRITVIPTGTELVPIGSLPKRGELLEFNGLMLCSMAKSWGSAATCHDIVSDNFSDIRAATEATLDASDIVIINAGSSSGREDFSAQVIADLGEVFIHGVAIRPGHPVVLGICRGKPVLGIPGYPVSAALTFELFVRPLIDECLCQTSIKPRTIPAVIARNLVSPSGDDEFIRVQVGRVGNRTIAAPLDRGAGVIMSLVRADGLVKLPRFSEGVESGTTVTVELFGETEPTDHTAVAIGSHDPALDVLASEISRRSNPLRLVSTNAGSYGGLLALRRDEAHLAGCHLLDPSTGTYNVTEVRRVLHGRDITLVNFVLREQGLIVQPGNPLQLRSVHDLTMNNVRFVNRQRGSGTRMLLEHLLSCEKIEPDSIRGYAHEQYTHLAIAADVKNGTADVGLGVRSAAQALETDFVPIGMERYDLVIPNEHLNVPAVAALLKILRDPMFAAQVSAMGGYDTTQMGEIVAKIDANE